MSIITGIVFGIMGLYLIGYPILTNDEIDELDYKERIVSLEEDIELRKEAVFSELGEIELDYQMNKLSEEDYHELKGRLQKLAVEVLQEEENS
ncbi:hypothetical protein [Selenihalanaerobacter shriftii]|uniref:Uncharacterized protein n=1 Tax=Selenihalanaerobacter shriftii TaxID=142842 RepID=A0A1T4MUD6_9FIRM|nr:hypothetical protein [Selenihalanaerobacter shriftii]SJZ70437.1 hypothetical protein SAMN02745118_01586 [Selenihalanaerobacter shriftii]